MRGGMSVCLAVALDPHGFSRVRAAVLHLGEWQLCGVPGWDEAWAAAALRPPRLVVFDPFPGAVPTHGAAAFAAAHPAAPLLAYGVVRAAAGPSLAAVLACGVRSFVTRDVDDTPTGFAFHLARLGMRPQPLHTRSR